MVAAMSGLVSVTSSHARVLSSSGLALACLGRDGAGHLGVGACLMTWHMRVDLARRCSGKGLQSGFVGAGSAREIWLARLRWVSQLRDLQSQLVDLTE